MITPNPEDFLKDKFQPLRHLTDLPKSYSDKWEAAQKLVDHHMKSLTDPDKALPKINNLNLESLARFVAFQTIQIEALQQEMKLFYKGLDNFQDLFDTKMDKTPNLQN
jgi:hypothetical protein